MVSKKIKIIERLYVKETNGFESMTDFEQRINDFLATIESHHTKSITVYSTYAVIEYV